ncbi:uncharacterized protein LOC101457703 isoform X1 [Ceratitis capitata]|uniref:uncharacterized protein LOC101457703 isoform X1 n=1 Tax=Ceratitis capitata TaxID=7213 RepID=UPI000329D6C7|nr:uncharacterized protein LOC101457703 isoform X1 [Ceratitis capitata]XP_023158443.1 uncharacterized protein LOC101457703 isoform X1 [Ceratitis capitata]XP_023158444.1 uncharacterized protein LOC101457703 isoform X1 [Ceratitis capitata]
MLAGIRKRLARKTLDIKEEDDDKDDIQAFSPPTNYITISQGKIQLVHQQRSQESDISDAQNRKDREVLENRIVELEEALSLLQERFNNSHCVSPTFEKELREQLDNMNRVIKSKERKQKPTCPGHKTLQTRITHQETLLRSMQQENYTLKRSIRHYERCLDDVMRKVVDAIVAEDILREEVTMLKNRVRDLEAQNAALSASPAKGRDEGYCTMSSGQPQPSNGHLEDLPEEPEQWLLPAEPCSTEMEDWSMSQEELPVVTLDDDQQRLRSGLLLNNLRRQNGENEWIWNSNDFLTSTTAETDSESEAISQLLQQKIVYSEDEDIARTEFTNEFYKLVDIRSASARSLFSYIEGETDDEDDDEEDEASSLSERRIRLRCKTALNGNSRLKAPSPTPSEAGRAQVTSCSSSESDEQTRSTTTQHELNGSTIAGGIEEEMDTQLCGNESSDIEIEDMQLEPEVLHKLNEQECIEAIIRTELRRPIANVGPMQPMVKSKSMMHKTEDELNGLNDASLNDNRVRPPRVLRSESVNGPVVGGNGNGGSAAGFGVSRGGSASAQKLQERLQQRPANSWRKSSGWKRVPTTPTSSPTAPLSPKKEMKTEIMRNCVNGLPKIPPTRIPTSVQQQQQSPPSPKQHQSTPTSFGEAQSQQQQQQIRKSKIPPPVPVRRSYAS